ncbi:MULTISPECIES: pitrilysin family protein [Lactobacillus]|uniref:M16 family metallopeptidase n=1 Tax=Lactobacillus TaxID=1578 RepID=UPI000CD8594B|nr:MULTISPECIES: pitrilysin family protein [Lactobacillus]RVU72319.1 insulinase family protein [Lactobacillus xujianguonis]
MIAPKIIKRKYPSGFEAEILLRPHFKQHFFGIIIDFGSSDPQKLAGSAHFLEHKLFAKKEGDLSQAFEKLGADVNAFTSFNETMFYCSGVDQTPKLLELLFRLVGEPYFTKQNVANEQPIIQQELAMYQDEPNWAINNALMTEMFGNSNLGIDVAGTAKSIKAINAQSLLAVYRENYLPSKMHFIACGDFSAYQQKNILQIVGKLQKKYFTNDGQVKLDHKQEKGQLRDLTLPSQGQSNVFGVGIRLKNFKKVLASLDLAQILLEIMLESKLSVMSPWFARMKERQLLSNPLQISVNYTRQGNFVTIFGTSSKSEEVIDAIKAEVQHSLKTDDLAFAKRFLALQKKEWLAQNARSLNNLSYLAVETAEESLDGEDSFANFNKLQTMGFEQYVDYCDDLMRGAEICSARLSRKEEDEA